MHAWKRATQLILVSVILVTTHFIEIEGADPSQPGFLCPVLPIADDPDLTVIPCVPDCQEQHNASSGECDHNENCLCTGVGIADPHTSCTYGFLGGVEVPLLCQCRSNASNILIAGYHTICDTDCKCNHGAASGSCDWGIRQCICDWPPGFVWTEQRELCLAAGPLNFVRCLTELATTGNLPDGCTATTKPIVTCHRTSNLLPAATLPAL